MFQEFVGYLLLPTNKAQRMMIIKGNGGEGKSQIGTVLKKLFGINAKDGSIGKISENQFARANWSTFICSLMTTCAWKLSNRRTM